MRKSLMLVLAVFVMGAFDAEAARTRSQPAPPVDLTEEAIEGGAGPTYLEVWVRVFKGVGEDGAPKYRVMMTSECGEVSPGVGGCSYAGAEAEFQRILDTGWYRIGNEAYPLHMIERVRFHTHAPAP